MLLTQISTLPMTPECAIGRLLFESLWLVNVPKDTPECNNITTRPTLKRDEI